MQAVDTTYPNITNHYVHTNTNPLFDYCHTLHPWLDAPPANPSNNLWFLDCIEKTNKLGGRSLLTGQRGNSTISWTGPLTRTPISALQLIRHFGGKQHRFLIEKLTKYGVLKLRPWTKLSGIHDKLAQETDLFHQYYQKYHQKNQRAQADFRVYYSDHMIDTLGTAAFSNTNRFLYDVELLDPTADKRIIEFCLRTPPEIFSHNEKTRLLVKNSLRNLLPECIRERTTRGMQAADWYLNVEKQKDQLKATLHSWEKNVVSDYLDINQLLKELEQWNIEKIRSSHGKTYHSYLAKYQNKLLRSMETGLFIQHHFGMT
jgi:asparagine synthase (glutamine-hydrolysing)